MISPQDIKLKFNDTNVSILVTDQGIVLNITNLDNRRIVGTWASWEEIKKGLPVTTA